MPSGGGRLRSLHRQPRSEPIIGRPITISAVAAKLSDFLGGGATRWTRAGGAARASAVGWAFSAFWHLLVLAVLALEVHPFRIPQTTPTVTVDLLPPLVPERPLERIEPALERIQPKPVRVQPIRTEKLPTVVAEKPVVTKPLTIRSPPVVTPLAPTPTPATQTDAPRAAKPIVVKPIEVQRPSDPITAIPSLAKPLEIQVPPSVTAASAEVQPAPAPPKPISIQSSSQVVAQKASPLPVLTNDLTTRGPVEIKPPDRPQSQARAGAAPPGAAGASGGGAAGGGGKPFDGPIAGFGQGGGLRMTLGCLNPDAYHLSAADRAACMARLASEAASARDLGPNISASKMAEYDRHVACHNAYAAQPTPGLNEASNGTSIKGLGNVPSLRNCGPGDR